MTRTCDDILRQWELPVLIDRLRANGIDEKALKSLTENLIKELIPEIGYRAIFLSKWKEFLKKSSPPSTDIIEQTPWYSSDNDSDNITLNDESDNDSKPSDNERKLSGQNCFVGEEAFLTVKRRGVHNLLKNTIEGRLLLDAYRKTKSLTRKSRNILVDVLVSEAVADLNRRLVNEDFNFLSNGIVKVFPTELASTYYIPPIKKQFSKTSKSVTARGKLVDKYRNKTRAWRRLTGSKLCDSFKTSDTEADESINENDHSVAESITWLGENQAPWQSVLEHWRKTAKYRQHQIHKTTDKSVSEIIERWPILKNPKGHVLIEEDFSSIKLTERSIELDKWKIFFQKLRNCCPLRKPGPAAIELMEILNRNDISDEKKVATQISFLAFLVPPKGRVKVKKSHWKPTTIECRESMIVHAKIPGDVPRIQEERIEAMKRIGLTGQPYIIVVGETLADIRTFLVCVDTILYEVPSALKALDVCFKTFHVLDATYSAASEHLWYLLQIGLYEFTTKYDKKISYIMEIVTAILAI